MKKTLTFAVLAFTSLAILAGCGKGTVSEGDANAAKKEMETGNCAQKLNLAANAPIPPAALQKQVDDFFTANPACKGTALPPSAVAAGIHGQ